MANGAILPEVSTAPLYLGGYSSFNGPFLNPMTASGITGWSQQSLSFTAYKDPRSNIAGDVGNYVYFPSYEGQYKAIQTEVVSSSIVNETYEHARDAYNTYTT